MVELCRSAGRGCVALLTAAGLFYVWVHLPATIDYLPPAAGEGVIGAYFNATRAGNLAAFTALYPWDIKPTSDDRPFFFNQLRLDRPLTLLRLAGRQWPWPWVWLLACAVVVALDPWALTQSSAMVRVLEVLRQDYDFVVIDTFAPLCFSRMRLSRQATS